MSLIYLASPHNHPDPMVRKNREKCVLDATIHLLQTGNLVFAPIVYSSTIYPAIDNPDKLHFSFWEKLDLEFISKCDLFYILILKGWRESVGVRAETIHAKKLEIPIRYMCYPDYFLLTEKEIESYDE